jgi:DNA-binding SARP family transcriptional activator
MSTLALSFLGPPLVGLDGALVKLTRRKVLALLAYLAVTGRPHSRDTLAELLYPGHDREQAFSDLRQTISALRSAIGEKWLETDRSAVALARRKGLRVDHEDFRRLVGACRSSNDEAALRQAAKLVRGPLLAGFYLKDCPEFEEWQAGETEMLRKDEFWVLERLVEKGEERREYAEAIEWCRKLLALDPVDEEAHRRLMLLYALAGKRTAALAQYRRCAETLRRELDEKPGPDTEELRRRIAAGVAGAVDGVNHASNSVKPAASRGLFVGRAAESGRLARAIEDARGGTGRAVVVVGEAGIGKTRLLEEATAAEPGALVLWGRCHNDSGLAPFWPWRQVLGALVRKSSEKDLRRWVGSRRADLATFVPDLERILGASQSSQTPGDQESARFRQFEAVAGFIRDASESRPIVLVLDDVHWADTGTLRLLEFVARGIMDSRLVILAACRDVENDRSHPIVHTLGELGRERGYERMDLGALSRDDIGLLARANASARSSEGVVELLWEKTRGNPLFALELLRSSGWEAGTADQDCERRTPENSLPPNVRAVIRQRIEGLGAGCVEVVTTAAAIGSEIDVRLVALVVNRTQREVLELLSEAAAARVVTEHSDRTGFFRFSHPLVRECLAAELAGAGRAEVHARTAAAMELFYGVEAEKHAIEIAHHLELSQPIVEKAKVARYSLLAGEQALTLFDGEAALHHFERGLEVKGVLANDVETAWLRFGLARALLPIPPYPLAFLLESNGEDTRGFTALAAAFQYFEETGDADSAARVAEHPWHLVTRSGEHRSLFDRALRLVKPGSLQEGRILLPKAYEDFFRTGDYAATCRLFERALDAARSQGDTLLELRVLTGWLHLDSDVGPIEAVREKIPRVLQLLRDMDDPISEHTVRFRAYHVAAADSDLVLAEVHAGRMAAISVRLRSVVHQLIALLPSVELAWFRGAWAVARSASDHALALQSNLQVWRLHILWRARLEFELGDTHAGERYLASWLGEIEHIGIGPNYESADALDTLVKIVRLSANPAAANAARRAIDAWPGLWEEDVESSVRPWWLRPNLTAGLALDAALRRDKKTAEQMRRWLSRFAGNWGLGFGLSKGEALGFLNLTVGDFSAAAAHFEQAEARYRRGSMRPSLAWCCSDHAEALLARGDAGDRKRAGELLREGLEIAESLGMLPLAERIRGLQARR